VRQHVFTLAALAALLCTLPLALAHAGENAWTVSGPPGGTFRDLKASPTDPNVFYAAYSRSFFRTSDGTATWQIKDFVHEVVSIAVDPTDGTRLYVAALQDGLFRSEDGGQTFTQIAPGDTLVWAVGVGGADGKTVYYTTGNGSFYQSTDRGQTFTARPFTPLGLSQIRVEGANGLSILAVDGANLMQSPDGGLTWTQATVHASNEFIQSFVRLGSGTLVATTSSAVYTSPDGVTWTNVLNGSFFAAAADPTNPTAFITANYGGSRLYRNTNNGNPANWTNIGTPPPLGTPLQQILTSGSPGRLILANSQGVQVSLDGGTTWKEASSGLYASAPTRMASTTGPNARVYAFAGLDTPGLFSTATDNGWLRLNLSGAQALNPTIPIGQSTLAVKPGTASTVYVGAFDTGMLRSDDGGTTWSGPGTGITGLSLNAIAFDPVDSNVMYASVSQGSQTPTAALYSSTDGGATWSPHSADLPSSFGLRLVVLPTDRNHLFLGTASGFSTTPGLYGSTDAGVHWSLVAFANQGVHDIALDPSDATRVYVAADATGLNVSSDGGATFTLNTALKTATQSQTVVAVAVDPVIPTTIYASTTYAGPSSSPPQSSYIMRSVDRGQTWETLRSATDQPTWDAESVMLDPNVPTLLYATTNGRGIGAFEIINDLALSISGHSGTKPKGVPSTFDVNVQNNGAFAGTAIHVAVQLPAGLTNVSGTVPTGSCTAGTNTLQCDVPVIRAAQSTAIQVTYTPPGEMSLPVSATVSAHERDSTFTNNTAQATATSGEVVDLKATIAASSAAPTVGQSLTYTVQASNAGPLASSSATLTFSVTGNVSLASTAPTGCSISNGTATCPLTTLAVGASQSFSFSATANTVGSSTAAATITQATNATDTDQTNNSNQATVNVGNAPPASSGGGGGSLDYLVLLALSMLLPLRVAHAARQSSL
jgi:uncharacterized repeat protein (TIGR01451 family)